MCRVSSIVLTTAVDAAALRAGDVPDDEVIVL
jgi:hypothetical protein